MVKITYLLNLEHIHFVNVTMTYILDFSILFIQICFSSQCRLLGEMGTHLGALFETPFLFDIVSNNVTVQLNVGNVSCCDEIKH